MRTLLTALIALLVLWCSAALGGQVEPEAERDEPVVGEGEIGVDIRAADELIGQRIREILDATGRYEQLGVEVRDGVVFLRGVAASERSRELAAELASRTDGVAVVVNDLRVREQPVWTLEPAAESLRSLGRTVSRALPLVAIGGVLLIVSILLAGLVSRGVVGLLPRVTVNVLIYGVVRKAVFVLVVLVGVYVFLVVSGLTRIALAVVSGTGLLGLIIGFAFRDIAENFLASLLLSVQRPFRIGDVIEVDGHTGIVRKVTTRGTLLIDFDGNHIQIANATVYKSTIKNLSANPNMRLQFLVGIGYDDDISAAQEVLRGVLAEHPAVLADPSPLILVEQLGPSTVNLRVYFWIDASAHSMLKVKSSAIRLSVAALARNGVSMPDEAREVIFPRGVPVRMLDAQAERDARPTLPRPEPVEAPAELETVTESEGGLVTETVELSEQARMSRDPDEGENVIATEGPAPRK